MDWNSSEVIMSYEQQQIIELLHQLEGDINNIAYHLGNYWDGDER